MKKVFILLTVLTAIVFVVGNAFAVDPISTKAAKATFGAATVTINVDLYDFVANRDWDAYSTTVDEISFTTSTITLGNTTPQWAVGKTFAKLSGNLMAQPNTTKIYMYTRNKTAGTYQAITPRVNTGNVNAYNGLVRKGHTAALLPGDYAAIKMICKKKSEAVKTAYPTDFTKAFGDGMRYLLDKDDSNFNSLIANNDCHVVIARGGNGTTGGFWVGCNDGGDWTNWWSGKADGSGTEDLIIFFGAQFDHVTGGSEYGTTTITFSTETE